MENSKTQKLRQFFDSNYFLWTIICIGIILRLVRYAHNPALWFDESVYAVDIINRPFSDLINQSYDWNSKPPYGFLILTKAVIHLFGNSEYAFRLFPLMTGIVSVPLFYSVARHYIKPAALPIALGLFAVLDPLVFQASNLKPYSGDMAFGLAIFLMLIHVRLNSIHVIKAVLLGLAGAIIIWFSHPSVFVLTGMASSLLLSCTLRKQWLSLGKLLVSFVMWAASFAAFYFLYTRKLMQGISFGTDLLMQFEKAFIPFPPASLADLRWLLDTFFETFHSPVGFAFSGLAAFTFLVGCFSLFKENKEYLFAVLSPILITICAAILHKYPFKGRLIVFLVPFFLMLIAEGTEYIREKISVYSVAAGAALIGVLVIYPVATAAYHVKTPLRNDDIRPVIGYVKDNWQEGDIVYVHYYSQYAFEYYTEYHPDRYTFMKGEYTIGIAPKGWYRRWRKHQVSRYYDPEDQTLQTNTEIFQQYIHDAGQLKGRSRVWVLFFGNIIKDGMQEEKFFVNHLEYLGTQLENFGRPGIASVYLYDLS